MLQLNIACPLHAWLACIESERMFAMLAQACVDLWQVVSLSLADVVVLCGGVQGRLV